VSQFGPWSLPFKSFPINYTLIIILFDAVVLDTDSVVNGMVPKLNAQCDMQSTGISLEAIRAVQHFEHHSV
jgi:hypothetical protein